MYLSTTPEPATQTQAEFKAWLLQDSDPKKSRKVSSYIKGLEHMQTILDWKAGSYAPHASVYEMNVEILTELYKLAKTESKNPASEWYESGISKSYLKGGFISAALNQLIKFKTGE